jgi:OPA family sugar phosphate sensor protein UhpC-like MFS transporter
VRSLVAALATAPDAPPLGDPAEVDRLYRRHRLRVMLAITVGYSIAYTCRLALGMVKKPLLDAGVFTAAELGLIGSALFYSYAFAKLTNGFLADHANLKRFFALGVFLSAIANIGMGFSTTVVVSVVLWALNGWFQGFGAPTGAVALAQWFGVRERGRMYGIWSTAHSIGEGLTFIGVAAFVGWGGWRWGFWGPGGICVATAVGILWLMQDRPESLGLPAVASWRGEVAAAASGAATGQPAAKPRSTWEQQKDVLRRPAVWILALASGLVYVTRYGINSWGVLYLQEARGFSLLEAGSILSLNTLAGVLGALSYGFLSDTLFRGRRAPANLLFAGVELLGLGLIFFLPGHSTLLLTLGFFVFGFGLTGLVTSLGGLFAIDIVSKRAAGAAMGFVGVFSYLAAAIQENVSGWLIERGTTVVGETRHYDFSAAVAFWVGASILSALLAALLWRVHPRD